MGTILALGAATYTLFTEKIVVGAHVDGGDVEP
jgi:hypothetical protein